MSLEDQLDKDFAPAWKPAAGDKLVGTVTDISTRNGAFGIYPIVTVRTRDGEELAAHCFHDVLKNELAKIAPKVGDEIGIRYDGKHPERGYHRYRVRRDGATAEVNWAQFVAEGTETTAPASDVPSDFPAAPDERRYGVAPEPVRAAPGDDEIPF